MHANARGGRVQEQNRTTYTPGCIFPAGGAGADQIDDEAIGGLSSMLRSLSADPELEPQTGLSSGTLSLDGREPLAVGQTDESFDQELHLLEDGVEQLLMVE